jgi:nickel superoxide dismutase
MHLLKIHIMKKINTIALISFVLSSAINLFGHCQVPCGIFADQHRFEQMLQDQSTIEKASRLISELSGKKDALSANQLTRWVATKEDHANAIQKTIADYFMAQRIKTTSSNYTEQLTKAHSVMVSAMKSKQSVDQETASALKKAILAFHKAYEKKK